MWRGGACLLGAAYGGGLVGTLGALAVDKSSGPSLTPTEPAAAAAWLLIFTLPGTLIVAGIFNRLSGRGTRIVQAYALAILAGALVGGAILTALAAVPALSRLGAWFGLVTSRCRAALHRALVAPAAQDYGRYARR